VIAAERGNRMRVVAAARRLALQGAKGGYLITPSARAYDTMHLDDLVFMGPDWSHGGGQNVPSTEWRIHRDIYIARPEVNAVVHTHSPYATTLACLRRPIPAFHYEVAFAGGPDIRCAPYATFGTQELSDAALGALDSRRACLLANHGLLAVGASVESAVGLADKVEALSRIYWQALQAGEPALLDGTEMARVAERMSTYGR
jgi:L-fuculose-phosphate aldolase